MIMNINKYIITFLEHIKMSFTCIGYVKTFVIDILYFEKLIKISNVFSLAMNYKTLSSSLA